MTYFWNDKVYAEFYDSTRTERGLVNKVTTPISDCWHPSRFGGESVGRGGLKEIDFRPFLLELDIKLTIAQARCLWKDLTEAGDEQLSYEQALLAYCKVREAPVVFKTSRGAAPPGWSLEEIPLKAAKDPADPSCLGPGLPLPKAADFLSAEGVPHCRIEELLQRYREDGAIPQASLSSLLEELPGVETETT
eukprot:s92_g42.t1